MQIPHFDLPCLLKHVMKCVWFIATYYDFSLQECSFFSESRWPLLSAVTSTSHCLTCGLSIWQGISVFFHQMLSSHRMASPCCVIFTTVHVRHLSPICMMEPLVYGTQILNCVFRKSESIVPQLLFRIVFQIWAGVDGQQ